MRSQVDSTGQPGIPGDVFPRLLVSVRSAEEAREALAGGADIIDIKEPEGGSLGAATPGVRLAVARAVAGAAPLTAALGELQDLGDDWKMEHQHGISLYKLGLSGSRKTGWRKLLDRVRERIQEASEGEADLVAVAYADWKKAACPEPSDLLEYAIDRGFSHFLLDTFDKNEIAALSGRARRGGLRFVAAGSLQAGQIRAAACAGVDVIAVRGAATIGARNAAVDRCAVRELTAGIRGAFSPG